MLFALLARIVYVVGYAETIPTYVRPLADAKIYSDWSARIASGDLWGRDDGVFYRAPLYPYVLAVLRSLFDSLQPATAILQSLLGLITALLTARLAWKWAGPFAALVTFGLLSFYGPLYTAEPKLLGTVLGLFLQVLVLSVALALVGRPRVPIGLLLGLLLGVAILVRPLWMIWILALPLVLWGVRSVPPRPGVWGAFLFGLVLTVAPVTIRNYVVGGDPVLVASNGGMTFFQGNNVENRSGLLTIISRFEMFGSAERQEEVEARVASELSGRSLRPSETSRFWFRQGLEFIGSSPGRWIELEGKKLFRFVSSFEPGDNYSHALERDRIPVLRVLFLPFGVILALALLALGTSRPFPPVARLVVLAAVTGGLGCLAFFVSSRYRLEAVPGLAVLAGVAVSDLVARLRGGTAPNRSGILGAILAAGVLAVTWLPAGAPARSQQSISLLQMGNAYERQGERDAARRAYRESIESLPENAFAWRSLLQLAVQDSGPSVALLRLESAPPGAREHPEIRHLRGRFLAALGRRDEAIAQLTGVTKERPEMREAWFYLGSALREEGRYPEAEVALERALVTGWPEAEILPALSYVRIQGGDLLGAREAANAALAADPEQPEARLNLLVADVYLGRLEEAGQLLAEREAEGPEGARPGASGPLTDYYRGLVAFRSGDLEEAVRWLGLSLDGQPGNRRARYYESLALAALGRDARSWPPEEVEDPVAQDLIHQWIEARCRTPWAGIPESGAARSVWDEILARPTGPLAEIIRYVGEEEAGLRPAGNP